MWNSALLHWRYFIAGRYESDEWIKSFTPFIELLQENYSLFATSLMMLQKMLKSLTVRMKISRGSVVMIIVGIFCSGSTYISFELLSGLSES